MQIKLFRPKDFRKSLSIIPGGQLNSSLENSSYRINSNVSKRLLDIFISLIVITLIMSWFYIIAAILIKVSSKGPVFFRQKRVGYMGGLFSCYKFRTMKINYSSNTFRPTSKNDERVTLIGKILRKSNLDELPQIFNVLFGDMSIIGPRPHPIAFHDNYSSFVENIDDRQFVKPGITGLAQIKGFRGDVMDMEENKKRVIQRVNFDIAYIKKWTLKLDFYILFQTAWQMISRKTNGH